MPDRILKRYMSIHDALSGNTALSPTARRYATALLADAPGEEEADVLALNLEMASRTLTRRSGRALGPLNHPIRYVVVASLLAQGAKVERFCEVLTEGHRRFRAAGLRRGGIYETLALLILQKTATTPVGSETIARFQSMYKMMKSYHWWLTGPDDYPFCALLSASEGDVATIGERVEAFYQGLRAEGFSRGDQLQLTSHILRFHPDGVDDVIARFSALVDVFSNHEHLWLESYDEIALLCFPPVGASEIAEALAEHLEVFSGLEPRPEASLQFSLATGTVVRSLHPEPDSLKSLLHAHALVNAAQDSM